MAIQEETLSKFKGTLETLLKAELEAGNEITETYEGEWPYPNSVMIFLKKPFMAPIKKDLPGIAFKNINDPHYWKAEYCDLDHRLWLCCGFDGPNFDLL